jgi:hypothetical protein
MGPRHLHAVWNDDTLPKMQGLPFGGSHHREQWKERSPGGLCGFRSLLGSFLDSFKEAALFFLGENIAVSPIAKCAFRMPESCIPHARETYSPSPFPAVKTVCRARSKWHVASWELPPEQTRFRCLFQVPLPSPPKPFPRLLPNHGSGKERETIVRGSCWSPPS